MRRGSPSTILLLAFSVVAGAGLLMIAWGGGGEDVTVIYEADVPAWSWRGGTPTDQFLALITSEMDLRRVQSALPATVWAQVGPEAQERLAAGDSAVIVAYLGEFPTGGYAIRVRRVTVQAAETEGDLPVVTVTVARRQPAPGEFVIQAFTYPYDFVVVPKSSLPGEPYRVQFVDDDGNELNGGTSSPLGGPRRPSE